jgi:hypothetical protein
MKNVAVRNDEGEITFNHLGEASSRINLRPELPTYGITRLPFSFIHQCTKCQKNFRVAIRWSGEIKGFFLRMFRSEEHDLIKINSEQVWVFQGEEVKKIHKYFDSECWHWAEERQTLKMPEDGWPLAEEVDRIMLEKQKAEAF